MRNRETRRKAIAHNVRRALFEADMSQKELAEKMGITSVTLSSRVNAKKAFDTDQLEAIESITGYPLEKLISTETASQL